MVLRGGENIYSAEVEASIYEFDGVHEAVVFGIPINSVRCETTGRCWDRRWKRDCVGRRR